MVIVVTEKHQKQLFIQVKLLFSAVESSNTVIFLRNARFDVILTSVTIIKQVFLCKFFIMSHLLT